MLTVVGDVIEYDGKPFAIITAPLSGWRMDAIDAIDCSEEEIESRAAERAEEIVDDRIKAALQDDDLLPIGYVVDAIDKACADLWISFALCDEVKKRLKAW